MLGMLQRGSIAKIEPQHRSVLPWWLFGIPIEKICIGNIEYIIIYNIVSYFIFPFLNFKRSQWSIGVCSNHCCEQWKKKLFNKNVILQYNLTTLKYVTQNRFLVRKTWLIIFCLANYHRWQFKIKTKFVQDILSSINV